MKSPLVGLKTLLILGRVSNLPTVWSNLLVGWLLADGPKIGFAPLKGYGPNDTIGPLLSVLCGGSFLYIGGMYLNDYCDAAFDARYCPQRPVPSGQISRRVVGLLAALWFTAGLACFASFGPVTIGYTLLLLTAIVVYDFHHKDVAWAPVLMATCRCLLYLLAFSSFRESYYFGVLASDWWDHFLGYLLNDCWAMASSVMLFLPVALPLGLYVAGITYLARGESRPGKATRWTHLPLALVLVVLAGKYGIWIYSYHGLAMQDPPEFWRVAVGALVPSLLLPVWMAWLLIPFWRKTKPSIGRVVSGLLAGIVLLDMIVISLQIGPYAVGLAPLFLLAILLQRVVPAT